MSDMATAASTKVPFLIAMMLLTGVCNTLLSKYQDLQCVAGCDSSDSRSRRLFSQPVIQTIQMFIGETACWLVIFLRTIYNRKFPSNPTATYDYDPVIDIEDAQHQAPEALASSIASLDAEHAIPHYIPYKNQRMPLQGVRLLLLALPSCCDIAGTTLMNVGLLFVAASIYQMTRGALVLFVGFFSVIFLKRSLALFQWGALVIVVLGVMLVGMAGFAPHHLHQTAVEPSTALRTVFGVGMIALAQIFTASQFVLEEYILEKFALDPIKVVGWEGLFGLVISTIAMIILHLLIGRLPSGQYGYFDAINGWHEVVSSRTIAISSILIMISIGGFNFFGLSVTRSVSATARSTIDTCRTLFIWIVSLGLGWESFKWLQLVGFAFLVYGTFLFNELVRPPLQICLRRAWSDRERT